MSKPSYGVRIDKELHDDAVEILSKFSLDFATGINLFLSKVVLEQGIPFDLHLENGKGKKAKQPTARKGANSK